MTSFDNLKQEATNIQSFLEISISENVEEVKQRLTDLSVYNARTGNMLADAKYYLNSKLQSEIMDMIKIQGKALGMSSSVQNTLCKSMARDEQHLVDWIERINRATVHQIDILRSVLSYEKEQLRLTPNI